MKKEIIVYVLLAAIAILPSCIDGKSEGHGKLVIDSLSDTLAARGVTLPRAKKLDKEERTFLLAAFTAGNMEIQAGNLAAVQSKNPEIVSLGTQMVTGHRKAIEELTEVVKKLGLDVIDSLTTEQSRQLKQLTTLDDQAFDKQYITMMIADYAKTIKLFQEAANLSSTDLSTFAANTIPMINAHHKMAVAIGKKLNLKNANNGDDIAGQSPSATN